MARAGTPKRTRRQPFEIGDLSVRAGERGATDLAVAQLYTHTELTIPIQVVHGRREGPVLLVSAAIHGDELNGVEIIRRLMRQPALSRLKGTLITAPVVNVFGFIHRSRYLPDRRDLNRCFPGSGRGSLGSRVANLFKTRVLDHCSHLIDLHTGAIYRSNLPQVRGALADEAVHALARSFGLPVVLDSEPLEGSLRQEAKKAGIPAITYEGGEALRFDEPSIRAGLHGCLAVMRELGMLPRRRSRKRANAWEPVVAHSTQWVRAEIDGVFRQGVGLGAHVRKGDRMGWIASPLGEDEVEITAPAGGVLIGRNNIPLVHEGEALFHLARFDALGEVARGVEDFTSGLRDDADSEGAGLDPDAEMS